MGVQKRSQQLLGNVFFLSELLKPPPSQSTSDEGCRRINKRRSAVRALSISMEKPGVTVSNRMERSF